MSTKPTAVPETLYSYLLANSLREHPVQRELREKTAGIKHGGMQISPDQGQFMAMLVKLLGAKRTIEVGVFTGYSSLSVALALPADGKITACDVSEEWTGIAREAWKKAGVAEKIELRLAPALQTLDALLAEGGAGRYDFAFIDADKTNYLGYYERCLELVRRGGIVSFDNTLWNGWVAEESRQDEDTVALRKLNEALHRDERVDVAFLTIGDGFTLALKR
jgi:predicted O-methyltransferase YrrM